METDPVSTLFKQGINVETLFSLGMFIIVLWLLYEIRRAVAHYSRYRRVINSRRIRIGDKVQVDGNSGVSTWVIDAIEWPGVWMHRLHQPGLRRWEPPDQFLDQPRVFERNGEQRAKEQG